MTFAHNWNVYFHMINHYKKIKNAKAVVDCSSPKGYNGNLQENKPRCVPNTCPASAPRSCSPECPPKSRPVCTHKSDYQRCISAPNNPDWRPCWKDRNSCRDKPALDDLEPANIVSPFREYLNKRHEKKTEAIGAAQGYVQKRIDVIKPPADAVRHKEETPISVIMPPQSNAKDNVSEVKDHEYVYFLLKITEDILRNNIYNENDMEKLFNSHVQANKGRLAEARMRQQIGQLRRDLLLPLEKPEEKKEDSCSCQDGPEESTPASCKCCPAMDTDGKTNLEGACVCDNPTCPANGTDPKVQNVTEVTTRKLGDPPNVTPGDGGDTVISALETEDVEKNFSEAVAIKQEDALNVTITSPAEVKSRIGGGGAPPRLCNCDKNLLAKPPEISGQTIQIMLPSPEEEKTESEKPQDLQGDQKVESQPQTEAPTQPPVQNTEKATPEDPKRDHEFKTDCLDPMGCDYMRATEGNKKVAAKSSHGSPGTSTHSMFKMKALNKEDTNSQIVFYNGLESDSERCLCTLALQKKALKIQVDNKDEEYILVDGPVCMPRSMLETKTISVLIQNVSSVVLNTGETASQNKPNASRVNLFQRLSQVAPNDDSNMDSISGFIQPGRDGDYDMMPEREIKDGVISSKKEREPILKHDLSRGSNNMPKTASFYEDLVTTISAEIGSGAAISDKSPNTSPKICSPCGSRRTSCFLRSRMKDSSEKPKVCGKNRTSLDDKYNIDSPKSGSSGGSKKIEFVDVPELPKPDSSQQFEVTTKDEDVLALGASGGVNPKEEILSIGSIDSARKYHYLLVDVATSTTSFNPSEKEQKAPSVQSEPLPEEGSTLSPIESIQDQYMLLVDEQYETEKDEESPEKSPEEEDSLHRLSATSTADLESEVNTLFSQEKVGNWADKQIIPAPLRKVSASKENKKIFQYPTVAEQMKSETELQKTASDSIQERLSIAESYRRGSIMTPEPDIRSVQPIESLTTPLPFQNHPPVLKQSVANASQSGLRPHEGLKVRYSMTREFFDQQQQDTLKKLEAVPSADENNMAAINEKMKEFRRIEDDNDAQRRFQITNPDHFEIRRVSVQDSSTVSDEELEKNKRKAKGKCCGLGQPTKTKRNKASVSSTDSNPF